MSALNTLTLCETLNCSPAELEEMDGQFVADTITILRYRGEVAKAQQELHKA